MTDGGQDLLNFGQVPTETGQDNQLQGELDWSDWLDQSPTCSEPLLSEPLQQEGYTNVNSNNSPNVAESAATVSTPSEQHQQTGSKRDFEEYTFERATDYVADVGHSPKRPRHEISSSPPSDWLNTSDPFETPLPVDPALFSEGQQPVNQPPTLPAVQQPEGGFSLNQSPGTFDPQSPPPQPFDMNDEQIKKLAEILHSSPATVEGPRPPPTMQSAPPPATLERPGQPTTIQRPPPPGTIERPGQPPSIQSAPPLVRNLENIPTPTERRTGPERRQPGRPLCYGYLEDLPDFPPGHTPLPPNLSLEEICWSYPNHLNKANLRPFVTASWTGGRIFRSMQQRAQDCISASVQQPCNKMVKRLALEKRRMEIENERGRLPATEVTVGPTAGVHAGSVGVPDQSGDQTNTSRVPDQTGDQSHAPGVVDDQTHHLVVPNKTTSIGIGTTSKTRPANSSSTTPRLELARQSQIIAEFLRRRGREWPTLSAYARSSGVLVIWLAFARNQEERSVRQTGVSVSRLPDDENSQVGFLYRLWEMMERFRKVLRGQLGNGSPYRPTAISSEDLLESQDATLVGILQAWTDVMRRRLESDLQESAPAHVTRPLSDEPPSSGPDFLDGLNFPVEKGDLQKDSVVVDWLDALESMDAFEANPPRSPDDASLFDDDDDDGDGVLAQEPTIDPESTTADVKQPTAAEDIQTNYPLTPQQQPRRPSRQPQPTHSPVAEAATTLPQPDPTPDQGLAAALVADIRENDPAYMTPDQHGS